MHQRVLISSAGILLALIGNAPMAHHAFSAVFDPATSIDLIGTVTRIEWTNPHVWIYMDVDADDDTAGNWGFELGSPNTLVRRGWSHDALKEGEIIIVSGALARDGSQRAAVRSITLRTGERLFGGQNENR